VLEPPPTGRGSARNDRLSRGRGPPCRARPCPWLISSPPFGRRIAAREFGGLNPWETEWERRWTIGSAGVPGLECADTSALWFPAERAPGFCFPRLTVRLGCALRASRAQPERRHAAALDSAVGRVRRTRPAESARFMGLHRSFPRPGLARGGVIHAPVSDWSTKAHAIEGPFSPRFPPLLRSWPMSRALGAPGPVGPGYTPPPLARRDGAAGRVRRTRPTTETRLHQSSGGTGANSGRMSAGISSSPARARWSSGGMIM